MPRDTPLPLAASLLSPPVDVNSNVEANIRATKIEEISLGVLPLLIPCLIMIFIPDLNDGPLR